ncbi:MAG TPA: hypothetical protein VGN80_14105 [Devosiaceae bacterium]|jgi:hypothetical protein|nr:hypothetical protein [Devosiaceae bacterium]
MATDRRSRKYLKIAVVAFVAILAVAFLYMFVQFSGIGGPA